MPWIDIAGVVNMRDLGGLPTADGGRIAPGRLIRSDNLQDLTVEGVRYLVDELGVTDIVDLRGEREIRLEGPGPMLDVETLTHHVHSLFRPRRPEEARDDDVFVPAPEPVDRGSAGYWAGHYLNYLADRPDSVAAALAVVANSHGATIVHCAAGKDRTGTVVGMALDVAGVPHDVIVDDYVRSGERIEAIFARLAARPAYAEQLAGRVAISELPQGGAMEQVLAYAAEEFGGSAGWLRAHGWSGADVQRLRDRLLVDSGPDRR